MSEDDENIFCTSSLDRYAARPDSVEKLTLADFSSNYSPYYGSNNSTNEEHGENYDTDAESDEDEIRVQRVCNMPDVITLKNNLGKMRKRRRPCVIRFHKVRDNLEEKCRSMIMLYYPWRNEEEDLIGPYETRKEQIRSNKIGYDSS